MMPGRTGTAAQGFLGVSRGEYSPGHGEEHAKESAACRVWESSPAMTASTDTKPAATKSSSRRALLAGALGGIGAVAAGAMAKVSPVRAEGEAIVVGGEYTTATSATTIINSANGNAVLQALNTTSGVGVIGTSGTYTGVYGSSNSYIGVRGSSSSGRGVEAFSLTSTGLLGSSGTTPPAKPKTGVFGYANQDSSSKGVWGFSGTGVGVYAQANKAGYALQTNGRIKASKVSGVKTIGAGLTSVTLNPGVKVSNASFVLLTPRVNLSGRDIWYTTNPSAGTITIHLSSSRSANTKIGWLLLG